MRLPALARLSCLWLALAGQSALAAPEDFPKPAPIVPRVEFWKRVYTEVDTKAGLLHDGEDLSIVYEAVRPAAGLSPGSWQHFVDGRRSHYKAVLSKLGRGHRSPLSSDEARVLALFPKGVSDRTLRGAAGRVRFQLGQADKFQAGLARQGRWKHYMRQAFEERGLPSELTALPHVESSFNPYARSSVGASGLWQFMPSTGRLYMRVDNTVDERNDPWVATIAAARLLKSNYQKTDSWPIALTAYNHGLGGMLRAMRTLGTRDIGVIVERYQSRSFGFASKNFYSEFLAALEIDQNPERFFGAVPRDPPEAPEIVVLDHYYRPTTLVRAFGVSLDSLRDANLGLADAVWNGEKLLPKGYALRVPPDPLRAAPKVVLAEIPAKERLAGQYQDRTHKVRRGETLGRIASRYGVSVKAMMAKNGLRSANRIHTGQRLAIPGARVAAEPVLSSSAAEVKIAAAPTPEPASEAAPSAAASADGRTAIAVPGPAPETAPAPSVASTSPAPAAPPAPSLPPAADAQPAATAAPAADATTLAAIEPAPLPEVAEVPLPADEPEPIPATQVVVVRRGETLGKIARRFRVSEQDLVDLNHLPNKHSLSIGQKLQVPTGVLADATPERKLYTVRRGDTLGRIAQRFGVSQSQLLAANRISNRHAIRAGQRLLVPTEPD